MKKILLVGGCSFTANNFVSSVHPELDTSWPMWPELLAKKIDMQLMNVGVSGAGNEQIFSSILDVLENIKTDRIGLVIAAWSQSQRGSWTEGKHCRWRSNRVEENGDIFYWVKKTMKYWHMFQIVCEKYNLPYKQFQMIPLFDHWLNDMFKNDWELAENRKKPKKDFVERYKYPGDRVRDRKILEKWVIDFQKNINTKNFWLWPPLNTLTMEGRVLKDENDMPKKGLVISRYDAHPTRLGQEKLFEFIHKRLIHKSDNSYYGKYI